MRNLLAVVILRKKITSVIFNEPFVQTLLLNYIQDVCSIYTHEGDDAEIFVLFHQICWKFANNRELLMFDDLDDINDEIFLFDDPKFSNFPYFSKNLYRLLEIKD